LLSVVDDARHLIGLDLAESEFRGAVVNLRGTVRHRLNIPVNERDGEEALAQVFGLIDQLIAVADCPILGIGIGTPGLMDAAQGVVRYTVNLDWQNLPLGKLLETQYHLPIYIANDSQAAALAEYTFGHGRDISNLIVVKVGRGVGAGIVVNGQLYFGDGFGAGEIGHVVMVEGGQACRCGHFGCLETLVSSRSIVRQAQAIARSNSQSLLHRFAATPEAIDADVVLESFGAGDETLRPVIAEAGRYLGIAVANLVGAWNIHRIVMAGTVARFGEALLEPIRQEMRRRSLATLANETDVSVSNLGTDIVILGAAALLLSNELSLT
jgi:glucokinase-like ROK family protein